MEYKKIIVSLFLVIIISSSLASAITGSIGNARIVLRPEKGEVIERSILVRNTNNISLDINLSAKGDLAEYVNIIDKNFRLAPGEEKKAKFTIKAEKDGTTETNINVLFDPVDDSNGVGLTSTIIVIVGDESDNEEENVEVEGVIDPNTGEILLGDKDEEKKDSKKIILFIIIGVVILALLVAILVMYRREEIPIKPKKWSAKSE